MTELIADLHQRADWWEQRALNLVPIEPVCSMAHLTAQAWRQAATNAAALDQSRKLPPQSAPERSGTG